MATQAIRNQATVAVSQQEEKQGRWYRVKDFLSSAVEVASMTFAPGASISHLESEYRANMTMMERTESDAYMNGIK